MRKDKVVRMTSQRRIILEELQESRRHPTADELYESVRRRLPRISLGTVYRNLETLTAEGLIQRLSLGGSQRRFDINPKEHYHIRCIQCGAVDDVAIDSLLALEEMIEDASNYEVHGVRLEFLGVCPACKGRSGTSL